MSTASRIRYDAPSPYVSDGPVLVDAVLQVDHGVARRVPAVTDVRADLELTDRAEALLADDLRPQPHARVGRRVLRSGPEWHAGLNRRCEPEAVLDTEDSRLRVKREKADGLLVELRRVPLELPRRRELRRRRGVHRVVRLLTTRS